ncbi:MAG: hypothetical protein KKF68_02080 [Nanoarchaeota archaeon]|nr:hypothetical protein [Nanoarchaeota archaeon]
MEKATKKYLKRLGVSVIVSSTIGGLMGIIDEQEGTDWGRDLLVGASAFAGIVNKQE